jgi:heme exporter protein B
LGRTLYVWIRAIGALVKKDLIDEYRTRYAVTSMALFALTTLVMVSFSTGIFVLNAGLHAAFLWIIIFFSAMSSLARSFIKEEEQGTARTLKMTAPAEVIYFGKLIYNLFIILALLAVIYPLYYVLMNPPAGGTFFVILLFLVLGASCLAGATTILAAMVSRAGSKNTLLPILAFPVLLPVLLTSIRGTAMALDGRLLGAVFPDLLFLLSFLVVIVTASLLLFPFVWED